MFHCSEDGEGGHAALSRTMSNADKRVSVHASELTKRWSSAKWEFACVGLETSQSEHLASVRAIASLLNLS